MGVPNFRLGEGRAVRGRVRAEDEDAFVAGAEVQLALAADHAAAEHAAELPLADLEDASVLGGELRADLGEEDERSE